MNQKVVAANIKIKRAYERRSADDGPRILVDRLWPRGVKKMTRPSIIGPRISRPARLCENGSVMIRPLAGISLPLR